MLTRAEMEKVIQGGGSVLHGGRLITKIEHLPTEADLAAGNPEQEALAARALEAQIAALQAQHDRLTAAKAPRIGLAAPSDQPPTTDDQPPTTESEAAPKPPRRRQQGEDTHGAD